MLRLPLDRHAKQWLSKKFGWNWLAIATFRREAMNTAMRSSKRAPLSRFMFMA